MKNLLGRVSFVTGGSRGIGRSISIALAEAGSDIVFSYKESNSAAQDTLETIKSLGQECIALRADVRDRKSLTRAMEIIARHWGRLDVLVNNAGINKPTDFDKITDEDWDEVLSINLKGPFIVSQISFPLLLKSHGASIINISSVSGQYGGPRTAHYAASKAGLISLSQVIARFGAQSRIRCNTIAVGLVNSDMASGALGSPSVQKAAESILLGSLGTFNDVAQAAVFLASDSSSYITAQTINVNGGLYF